MDARPAEFFVIDEPWENSFEARKVNGVVFKHRGRLLGLSIKFGFGYGEWWTFDIKTGMPIAISGFNPLAGENMAKLDDVIKESDAAVTDDERMRFTKAIKAAYDEHPEIKRQVFGE